MSDALRIAVNELVALAIQERDKLSQAVRADHDDAELQQRIADGRAGQGFKKKGKHQCAWFPYTGSAKLRDELTPNHGSGVFDKAFQRANILALASPAAAHVLPKLEALHRAHHDLIQHAVNAAERSQRTLSDGFEAHCNASNALALTFSLYDSSASAVTKLSEDTPAVDDEALFAQVTELVRSNPDDFREAGKWLDDYFTDTSKGHTVLERFDSAWRDVLDRDGFSNKEPHDLAQMKRDERFTVTRRVLLLTWIVSDPDADSFKVVTRYQKGSWPASRDMDDSIPPDIYDDRELEPDEEGPVTLHNTDDPPNRWTLRIATLHTFRDVWMPLVRAALRLIEQETPTARAGSEGGKSTTTAAVRKWAEGYMRDHDFPGINELAKVYRGHHPNTTCNPHTIRAAITASEKLQGWEARGKLNRAKQVRPSARAPDSGSTVESGDLTQPEHEVFVKEAHTLLLKYATEDERKAWQKPEAMDHLRDMSDEKIHELVEDAKEQHQRRQNAARARTGAHG